MSAPARGPAGPPPAAQDQRTLYERQSAARGDMREHYRWFAPARRLEDTVALAARHPAARVLEVGCGDGVLLAAVAAALAGAHANGATPASDPHSAAAPPHVVGVDLAHGRLVRARSRLAAGFACASADALPLRAGTFDLVLCAEVLEHLLDPAGALRELRRVTRPGGRLVLSVPVVGWSRWLEARLTGRVRFLDEDEHVREYAPVALPRCETVDALEGALATAGFAVAVERGVYAFPHRGERVWHALLAGGPLHGAAVALDRALGRSAARRWGRWLLLEATAIAPGGSA